LGLLVAILLALSKIPSYSRILDTPWDPDATGSFVILVTLAESETSHPEVDRTSHLEERKAINVLQMMAVI